MNKKNYCKRAFILSFVCLTTVFSPSVSYADNELDKISSPSDEDVRRAVVAALIYQENQRKAGIREDESQNIDFNIGPPKKFPVISPEKARLLLKKQDQLRASLQKTVETANREFEKKKLKRKQTQLSLKKAKPVDDLAKNTQNNHKKKIQSSAVKNESTKVSNSKDIAANKSKLELAAVENPVGRNKTITGWVYLGHFKEGKWESGTLELGTELPKVGKQYLVKAARLNVRDAKPKKGRLGKVIYAFYANDKIKVLKLMGSGRNPYYWAEILRE